MSVERAVGRGEPQRKWDDSITLIGGVSGLERASRSRAAAETTERSEVKGFEPRAQAFGRSANKDFEGSNAIWLETGAGEGIRTLDPNLGKVGKRVLLRTPADFYTRHFP